MHDSGGGEWKYCREITVRENSGELQLSDACGTEPMTSQKRNLTYKILNGCEELNYWIEEWDAEAKKMRIWVKVPSTLRMVRLRLELWSGKCKRDVLESKKFCPLYKATTFIRGNKYDHWGNYASIGLGRYSYPVTH